MSENKTGKYFKYAIGEIVLVVIGILIALSINNWNEVRKQGNEELTLLSEIQSDLRQSKSELEYVLNRNEKLSSDYLSLLDHIEKKLPYSPELDSKFFSIRNWSSPYLTYTAYESMKSRGAKLVKNDTLRMQITTMYEKEMTYLMQDWDESEWRDSQTIVKPYYSKHFSDGLDGTTAKPNDYNALLEDVEFNNMLRGIILSRNWGNRSCTRVLENINTLIESIENELIHREYYKS